MHATDLASGGVGHLGCAQHTPAVHALQGLLLHRFDPHRTNVRGTRCFEQSRSVCRIGLVAFDVSTDVLGWQRLHLNAQAIEPARSVVGRAAGFHDDQGHISVDKPAFKLGACQPLGFNHVPMFISHGQLKNRLCKINSNGSSIHVGLLLFKDLIATPMKTRAPLLRKKRGESIPSIERTSSSRLRLLPAAAHVEV